MKKRITLFFLASLATLSSCTPDVSFGNDTAGTFKANGATYEVKKNAWPIVYNTTEVSVGATTTTRTLSMMVERDFDTAYLEVTVTYANDDDIDGTYPVGPGGDILVNRSYVSFSNDYDYSSNVGSGSVKITETGASQYKIEFSNVLLGEQFDETTPTSLTGSFKAVFQEE